MATETDKNVTVTPAPSSAPGAPASVVVHPLVLLSVVDHFNRMGKIGNQNRVVGVLLGSWSSKNQVRISQQPRKVFSNILFKEGTVQVSIT